MSKTTEADRDFFCPPKTHVNIDRMRREGTKDAKEGKTTVIHVHASYDPCDDHDHEYFGFEEEGEA